MFHILKEHRTLNKVPFYCSLCGYKSFKKDQLERHLHTFPIHKKIKSIQHPTADDHSFFRENEEPVDIECGWDYVELAREQSRSMWTDRQRQKLTVASTVHVVPAAVTTAPKSTVERTQPLSSTVTSVSTVDSLLSHLRGKVAPELLESAMVQSGLAVSPSFSQASEPSFELGEEATPESFPSASIEQITEETIAHQEAETLEAVKGLLNDLDSTVIEPCVTPLSLTPVEAQPMSVDSLEESPSNVPTDATEPTKAEDDAAQTCSDESTAAINGVVKVVFKAPSTETVSTCTDPLSTSSASTITENSTVTVSTETETSSTSDSACQTDSWDTFVKVQMKEMFTEGMAVFGAVIGRKIAEASPANSLVGVQTNLAITNENLLQLAQCIESQNNLIRKEREKYSTSNFIDAVKTLSSSVNDMRADFRKFASLPASETQHSRTANALKAVVDGITQLNQKLNATNSTNSSNSTNPPAPLVSDFERQEFNRLLDSAFDNVSEPPKLKTLEDRKRQRTQLKPKENAPSSTVV